MSMERPKVNIFWFRRDLRLEDNTGLYHALTAGRPVVPVFIFDRNILDDLEDRNDARLEFIHARLLTLQQQLSVGGSSLEVHCGIPEEVFTQLQNRYNIETVFANHDYEAYGLQRDDNISRLLQSNGIRFQSFKDHVIFEKNEVLTEAGEPYRIFTPYSRRWKAAALRTPPGQYDSEKNLHGLYKQPSPPVLSLESLGFHQTGARFPEANLTAEKLEQYEDSRDYPAREGTSRLGIHLRFGTISIRSVAQMAMDHSESFLNELVWRDFFHMILWHFPHVRNGGNANKTFDNLQWRNNEREFKAWCDGATGYPFVDAGMRQLNATGYMHNRLRMVTASFLCRHLLIDWRWGEAYFAKKLLDYDYAANNGGWQWSAGTGFDAAPYFRIFNPERQMERFDRDLIFTKKWVPEIHTTGYPPPIVEHTVAKDRALRAYRAAASALPISQRFPGRKSRKT